MVKPVSLLPSLLSCLACDLYLVNGVRTATKKGSGKANLFQPTAILDLVVYHNEGKNLNRIKDLNGLQFISKFIQKCLKMQWHCLW